MRNIRYVFVLSIAFGVLLFSYSPVLALDVPPAPTTSPILDNANVLSEADEAALEKKIVEEQTSTGNQIAVLTIPSLEDKVIEEFSIEVARAWGVGGKDRDNGVLLLVAIQDRKVRIEVGYGLEGALTDIRSGQIIRDRITPAFRQQQYAQGISSGVDGIITAIHGEKDPNLQPPSATTDRSGGLPLEMLFYAILFIPAWLGSMLARTKSWWAGGIIGAAIGIGIGLFFGFMFIGLASIIGLFLMGLGLDYAVSRNFHQRSQNGLAPSWWAGGTHLGGNSSNSSGGFGGFGGGGFGGGGSSGDW